MTARTYSRGWLIEHDGKKWVYSDNTRQPCFSDDCRPCARCGKPPTSEGYDACLGHIPGVAAACCGHGVQEGWVINSNEQGSVGRMKSV